MAFKMKGVPYPKKSPIKDKEMVTIDFHESDNPHKHRQRTPGDAGKAGPPPTKAIGRQRKLKKGKTLKTEHPDTYVDQKGSMTEQISDLEDRIGFIKEDINNQVGGATAKQKKDMAAMEKRISKIRGKMETGKGSYGKEEYDKE